MLLGQLGMPGWHLLGNLARHLDQVGVHLRIGVAQQRPERLIGKTAMAHKASRELLRVENLYRQYSDNEVLKGVSLKANSIAEEGRTMLVLTHEMGFAREVSNHVIFVHQGRVEEEGDPREVLTRPTSERLQQFLSGSLK
jgi:ABC-type arginine transport system ATPase subunit